MTLILSVVLTVICTIGIAFNGYTVLVILLARQVNTANNILLLHLGIINIFIGILFLIFCLPGIKGTEWASAGAPCAVNGFFFTLLHPLVLWTICGLNCDRYYAIAAPLHYTHIVSTRKQMYAFIVLALFGAISAAFPADLEKASDVSIRRDSIVDLRTPNEAPKANAEIVALVQRSVDNDLDTDASMIFRPLFVYRKFSAKKKRVLVGLFLGWINSILLAIPPLFNAAPYRYLSGLGACAPEFRTGIASVWYAAAYTGFTLLLPATVFICCNVKILIIARYHRHRIASAIFEVALSAQVTITHQRNPFFVPTITSPAAGGPKLRGSNPILAVFLLVASFLLMCVPYYILVLYEAASYALNIGRTELVEVSSIHHFYMAAGTLLICSPAVNGYLYGLKNKSLKKAFMNYWRKKQTKNEVHHEIQARTPSTCGSRRPSLTPFGVFTRNPNVSRRMSETLIDVNKSLRSPRSKIKRNTSEVMWRHASANSLNLSPKDEAPTQSMKQTISCNTLRVPEEIQLGVEEELNTSGQKEETFEPITKTCSPGNLLLKIFKFDDKLIKKAHNSPPNDSDGSPKRSPRILITRAFSEESEKSSQNNSPHRDINRKLSNSASNLIEKKWRQMKYQDEETDSDCAKSNSTTKPLLGSCSLSNRSSESSETSGSSGKIYMNLDERRMSMDVADQESNEEQLLLTWNSHKRYHKPEDARRSQKSNIMKVTVQTKEIVL